MINIITQLTINCISDQFNFFSYLLMCLLLQDKLHLQESYQLLTINCINVPINFFV